MQKLFFISLRTENICVKKNMINLYIFLLADDDSQKAGPSGLRNTNTSIDDDNDDDEGVRWDIFNTKTTKTNPPYSTVLQNMGTYQYFTSKPVYLKMTFFHWVIQGHT